jgi:hypothetical protein
MVRFITILAPRTWTLIVNGTRHELKYARAATLPGEMDTQRREFGSHPQSLGKERYGYRELDSPI